MIVIIDYKLGNLFSVAKSFEMLGEEVKITDDIFTIQKADRIVLPGVGAFGDGMRNLEEKGLTDVLTEEVIKKKKPFLGICLGMQLLADKGYEYGEHVGLGWIPGQVRKIETGSANIKIPHIGWNNLEFSRPSLLFKSVAHGTDFYFLHSFQLVCSNNTDVIATTMYGEIITAAIEHQNIFATQFHPEKSQEGGLTVLNNFLAWKP